MGDSDAGDAGVRELHPAGRFEWERIIKRARCGGLVAGKVAGNGKKTRGDITAATFKAVAFVWASYADEDGRNIFPGDATLAVDAEVSLKTAKAVKAKLVELGLTERVRAGARRLRGADEYRLTFPSDLVDQVDVLSPAQAKLAAERLREANRGKRGGSSGPLTKSTAEGPTGVEQPVDNPDVRGPVDPVHPAVAQLCGGSSGPARDGCGGSSGPVVGGPVDPRTNQDHPRNFTNHPESDLRTAVAVARATPAPDQDPIRLGKVPSLADARAERARTWGEPPTADATARARRGARLARQVLAAGGVERAPAADGLAEVVPIRKAYA